MDYPMLFSPLLINGMMTKNRIVATPTSDHFEDKALGGAGIVIAGHAIVEPGRSSYSSGDEPDAFAKYEVEATRRRILKVHQGGARASIEIFHGGEHARVKDFARGPDAKVRADGVEVRAMTEADMEEVLEHFARTVRNARDVGFDMVFMHFGHGWLPAQFLSPRTNHRTDEYGGSLENRARFPLRILETVREAVGADFPVDMRISAVEFMEGSIEFDDVRQFIQWAEPYIDAVQISAGVDIGIEGNVHMATTNFEPHHPNAHWAAQVREVVQIPVGVVGAVMSPDEGERLLQEGAVDLIALGRPLIADPEWPRKAQEGRASDITPCLRCLQCYHISTERRHVGCSVNPRFWNEEFIPRTLTPAVSPKRLVVVGGGPAGITGALTASRRGHEVILLEREGELGGQLRWIAQERFKEDIAAYLAHLVRQVESSSVDVRLGVEATRDSVAELRPDALIIAVGAREIALPVPGVDLPHVLTGNEAVEREHEIGEAVVILGAGQIGTEIGLELATFSDRHVTLLDTGDTYARRGNTLYREGLRQKLEAVAGRLEFAWGTACERIEEDRVLARDADGARRELRADTVIVAVGMTPRDVEAQRFYGIVPEVVTVGDCVRPRIIQDAVFEAHSYAMNL
ncbi:FAD-dependent oxidoreductase [Demequina zhanjiangensis]|uniref:FAD-dependent oxidoreductase n=1 Tax=Demequina zhanjiangensis TaxID=3051659 RepID=A0ABT8FYI9_9MICO|nr:FAD-dependent oxidoreductase [Demequina sp. SYSU T00b26]MDN4471774.1 FAD-dependent oxidoreductase [Demequina sp. SYSU T00b26]